MIKKKVLLANLFGKVLGGIVGLQEIITSVSEVEKKMSCEVLVF